MRIWKLLTVFSLLWGLTTVNGKYPALAQQGICTQPHEDVSLPLTELGKRPYVRMDGQQTTYSGGLYPNGSNTRPPEHEAAGVAIASQIVPLDKDGNSDPTGGKIVMISVGMSNTVREYLQFVSLAEEDLQINPHMFFINGAQAGQVSQAWVGPNAPTWEYVNSELARYEKTPLQVQVAWVKQTQIRGGDFPEKAQALQADLEAIARNLKIHFPNIKIAYFSSRTRSYTYWKGLSPEPIAFETGFAVKWLIEKQINHDPSLNFDPMRGEVKAPYLSWGPYLWIDGVNPRSDGRVWMAEDLAVDCVHPSQSGARKVAEMLLEFFKTDSTSASWFLAEQASEQAGTATASPTDSFTSTPPPPPTETVLASPTRSATPILTATAPVLLRPSASPPAPSGPSQIPTIVLVAAAAALFGAGFLAGWLVFRRK